MNFFRILFVFLVPGVLWTDSANAKRLYLGAGATFFNMGKTTSASDGATSLPGQIYLPLTLSLQMGLSSRFELLPFVTYTPLAVTASDSINKRMLTAGVNLSFRNSGKYRLKGGLGLLDYQITGDGSTVTRQNGTGSATFYLPGTTVSSKSIFIDVGLTYHFHESLKLDLDAMFLSALSTGRSVSTTLSISKGVF